MITSFCRGRLEIALYFVYKKINGWKIYFDFFFFLTSRLSFKICALGDLEYGLDIWWWQIIMVVQLHGRVIAFLGENVLSTPVFLNDLG